MANDISALISSLSRWEIAGYVSIAAVAIGVAGESIHELTDSLKFQWWKANGGKASALLLIAALAAELIIQVKTTGLSGQIIAVLSEQEEDLRRDNLQLERALESERTERLTLQKKFSWRHLDDSQLRRIVVALLPFPEMPFDCEIADAESQNLLSEVSSALMSPVIRWVIKPFSGGVIVLRLADGTSIGVFIETKFTISYGVTREADFGPAARALASALLVEGIEATAESNLNETRTSGDQRIHLKIGSKPAF
jgi:hypothetical protein